MARGDSVCSIIPTLNVPNSVPSKLQVLHKNATSYLCLSHLCCSTLSPPLSSLILEISYLIHTASLS